ncbi:guanylate-binding protein 1-like [Mercenaria mercenaria]|uniref:guanylate-binding protein 1-like n=1 Tax=Mercenaria mercenaria TaxID=6596 RepID=UPI00234E4812|nr:guanylate-binding protein 1-like [Mercenaria mercenaria]
MCLVLKDGKGNKVVRYNATRLAILEHFQNRKCFVFDRPAERKKLRRLEELKQSELSEDFVTDTSCFLEYIYKCEPKKLIDGSILNGRMFSCLAKQYIEAICSGDLPCIDDALTKMCREENTFVVVQTVDWFKEQIKSIGMPLPSDFALKYKRIQKEALKMFKKMAVLDDEHEFQKTAEREMDAFKTTIDEDNNDYIKDVCTKELQKIYDIRIKPKVTKGGYFVPDGYKMYRGDFAGLRDQVKLTLSGADPNLVQKYILEFEERYQKQDGEIFQKAGFYDTQIKLEMQEQHAKLEQEKSELDSQVELRRKEETKEINLYKAELSAQMEQDKRRASENYGKIVSEWKKRERCLENQLKEHADMIAKIRAHESTEGKRTHKPTVGQTVMKTMLNASENYGTIVSEWKKRERCLEDQLKEHDDMIAKIREYESTEGKRTHKPTVGQTVMKTMLNLLPVVGPIATGIYERISSK